MSVQQALTGQAENFRRHPSTLAGAAHQEAGRKASDGFHPFRLATREDFSPSLAELVLTRARHFPCCVLPRVRGAKALFALSQRRRDGAESLRKIHCLVSRLWGRVRVHASPG